MTLDVRVLVAITAGDVQADIWLQAAEQEAVPGPPRPRTCPRCPLREDGEWRANAERHLAELEDDERHQLEGWPCHLRHRVSPVFRPCAGMRQVLEHLARTGAVYGGEE